MRQLLINIIGKFQRMFAGNFVRDKEIILMSQALVNAKRQLSSIDDLADVEFSAFSQWGEDGIIDWLISKIPAIPKTFVEFGVSDYREANTRFLLQLRNWRGLVIDSSSANIQNIRRQDISWRYQLDCFSDFITRENINSLISRAHFYGEIGLLSIDIDGNDYWVWESITQVNPVIVVIEYNAVFGDLQPITVPYYPEFYRTKAHYSNLYFGASLPALIYLGGKKGYDFVGSNTAGGNAFFVRNDKSAFITQSIHNISAYPSLCRESRNQKGSLLFLGGKNRSEMIGDCPLVNVVTGENTSLRLLNQILSDNWSISERKLM